MPERTCLVLLPVLAGGVLEFSVRARSSMHAASIARNRCEQPPDPRRKIRVIPGGKVSHDAGAAAHNGKLPCYDHSLHQVHDWELSQHGRCHIAVGEVTLRNIPANFVMEAAGHAILRCQVEGQTLAPLTIQIAKFRTIHLRPEQYWTWLLSDAPTPEKEHNAKALLRDRHAIPLTREEKRARQVR